LPSERYTYVFYEHRKELAEQAMTSDPRVQAFRAFFKQATEVTPYPYQERLALSEPLPQLLNIPTGLGKTAAVILAWLWRRRFAAKAVRAATPRRLVYCLPMRVLVEQTFNNARQWLNSLALLAEAPGDSDQADVTGWKDWNADNADVTRIAVSLLTGGEDSNDWDLFPERDAILIGTQDMLLSRALSRGYGLSRYRWPMHYSLLHNDCLWVMDEIQLMGSGLVTTAQLDAFGKHLWRRQMPLHFLWMSATLGESFLDTRDRRDWCIEPGEKQELTAEDHPIVENRLRAPKTIRLIPKVPTASQVLDEHEKHGRGRLSLLVLNTVPSAKKLFSELSDEIQRPSRKKRGVQPKIHLVHGRFRPQERKRQLEAIVDFVSKMDRETGAVDNGPGIVVVSTQVVEAGFDISSVRLWSEIAPWPSDIQRLGRLYREGRQPNAVATFWLPKEDKDRENNAESPNARRIGPYEKAALKAAEDLLKVVIQEMDAEGEYRDALDKVINSDESQDSLQVVAETVIRPDDFHELFSTEPDLAGGFTNVSNFVRDSDRNVDVHVFWRDFKAEQTGRFEESQPQRDEICPVPFFELQRFLGDKGVAWEWNSADSAWEKRRKKDVQPGMTLLLLRSVGGYSDDLGWTGNHDDKPTTYLTGSGASDALNRDPESAAEYWGLLNDHLSDVDAEVRTLVERLGIEDARFMTALSVAARWHDWGKSLEQWQNAVRRFVENVRDKMNRVLANADADRFHAIIQEWLPKWIPPDVADPQWAKFPDVRDIWTHATLTKDERKELRRLLWTPFSSNLRHEAASALAAWDAWLNGDKELSALAVYLIASHHGKVRTVLRSTMGVGRDAFGVEDDMTLPPVPGVFPNAARLRTDAKYVGAFGEWNHTSTLFTLMSPSWLQMIGELLGQKRESELSTSEVIPEHEPRELGPLVLAYFETLLRVADIRASCQPGKREKS
jgi:CRISPR-associated endonuclease/helicase Cas3